MEELQTQSPSARGNHPALRSCWHPAGYADELSDGPVPAELLAEPLVLWRDSAGTAHAFSDLCIHRGTALSLGTVDGDEIVRPEAPNTNDFPVFANEDDEQPVRRNRYELHLPYTIVLRLGWGGGEGMVYFFVSQPVREDECKGYLRIARNYNFDQPDDVLREFEDVIFDQDKRIVESQRPEQVPFDLAAELHMKFDAVAVAYRRAMRAEGLAR